MERQGHLLRVEVRPVEKTVDSVEWKAKRILEHD